MKKIRFIQILCLSIFLVQNAWATDYYFSSVNGNDANSGTSSGSPKQTVSAIQTVINSLAAGDHIYLERGSVWYETSLTISSITGTSGSPIIFDAYGTGENPVLSGQKILSSPSQSGNIYTFTDSDIPDINTTYYSYGTRVLGYVTVGGTPYVTSRHPNTGYYVSSSCNSTSVTDDLSWSTNEWQDGWIAMKVVNWQWSLARVSSNTSTTLTTTQQGRYSPSGAKHYFFMNAYNALDQNGEWFWDDGSLSVYWSGSLPEVKASVVDTIFGIINSDYIYVNNIDFIGANHFCVSIADGDNNKIDHCRLIGAAENGIRVYGEAVSIGHANMNTENNSVTNSEIVDCGLTGIFSRYAKGGDYSNNYIHRIAIHPGYQNKTKEFEALNDDIDGYAIAVWNNVATDMPVTIKQNFIDSVQAGITSEENGSALYVRENLIRNYGMGDLGDLGGFYIVGDQHLDVEKQVCRNIFLEAKEPNPSSRTTNYSEDYTHALYFDQYSYSAKGDSNSIENAQIALFTNSGIGRTFRYNNVLTPIAFSSMEETHLSVINNCYSYKISSTQIARADTFSYNNVVFGDLGEVGYKFSYIPSNYTPADTTNFTNYPCNLPFQGVIDYNKWFDPDGTSSSYIGARYHEQAGYFYYLARYSLAQWQSYSESCSGDTNDPGDNSTYNSSYSDPILLKNWSAIPRSFTLTANYVDADGNTVTGSTTVPAFYSKLLFKTSGTETGSDIYVDSTLVPGLSQDTSAVTTYSLAISYAGTGSGSVTPGSGSYPIDTTLTLSATADAGSVFAGWGGDTTSMSNPLVLPMWKNRYITATFTDTTSVPESDTIAYWRFENNANDEMGNYDATLYGSPSYESSSPAEGTYYLSLDGSGKYANCGTIELGSSFSICGYVKFSGTSGTRPLFATTSASSPDGIYATVNLSTGVFSLITGNGSSSATATSTTGNYSDWTWIKFEYIVDCAANTCTIKIDDEDESSSTTIVGDFTDNKTFYIGRDAAGSTNIFGRIDAFMIIGNVESEPDPVVTIVATDPNASEQDQDQGLFTFSLDKATVDTLIVSFYWDGTADIEDDFYPHLFGFVIIPAGESYTTMPIEPVDDAVVESDETVIFTLVAGTGYTIGSPSSATVTIADNDTASSELDTIGRINFTFSGDYDESGWTNVYTSSTFNENLGDGVYFSTSETLSGGINGEPNTIFPSNVGRTYHFIETYDNSTKYYTVSGLDTSHTYRFSFFESRDDNVSGDRTTTYTIDGSSVGMNPIGNTDSLVTITDVDPDASGEVEIAVSKISGQYGYINALLIIDEGLKRAKIRSGRLSENDFEPISYYPVPVTDMLNLRNVPQNSLITVYDIVGNRVISHKTGFGSDVQLNMSGLKAGIYLFKVVDETSSIKGNFKVVKK